MSLTRFIKPVDRFRLGSDLKKLIDVIGMVEVFYIVGLIALTVGASYINTSAAWITCGSIMLATSIYSYVGK